MSRYIIQTNTIHPLINITVSHFHIITLQHCHITTLSHYNIATLPQYHIPKSTNISLSHHFIQYNTGGNRYIERIKVTGHGYTNLFIAYLQSAG